MLILAKFFFYLIDPRNLIAKTDKKGKSIILGGESEIEEIVTDAD